MLNKLKFYLSLIIAKSAYTGIKILNRTSGTSFAGMVALTICPNFLSYCGNYINKKNITVTGTNGKSTTSGLIAHILETDGSSIIHNLQGANMLTGAANIFALNIKPFKKFDYSVIESDEAYLTKLYDFMKSDYLVVTNLFRDQLDRYGELTTTANFIRDGIKKNPDLKVILNADDPIVASFDLTKYAVYFGFENVEFMNNPKKSKAPAEIFNCLCTHPLKYKKQFFAHQGHYYCDKCGYKRARCDYAADVKIYDDYSELKVKNKDSVYNFRVNLSGLFNAYNALAAISLALENNISPQVIREALDTYITLFGRTEKRIINGHPAIIQLIKNPTGASEVLKTVDTKSHIVIAINDNYADGRDISWLWDTDFEQLKDIEKPVITSGMRANDMAARLKYAGIPSEKIIIEPNVKKAIALASKSDNKDEKITVLPSYTALLSISNKKKEG